MSKAAHLRPKPRRQLDWLRRQPGGGILHVAVRDPQPGRRAIRSVDALDFLDGLSGVGQHRRPQRHRPIHQLSPGTRGGGGGQQRRQHLTILLYGDQPAGLRRFRRIGVVLRRHFSKDSTGVRPRGPVGAPIAGIERLDRFLLFNLLAAFDGGRAIRSANGFRRHRPGVADGRDGLGSEHGPGAGPTGGGHGGVGPAGLRAGNCHGAFKGPAGPYSPTASSLDKFSGGVQLRLVVVPGAVVGPVGSVRQFGHHRHVDRGSGDHVLHHRGNADWLRRHLCRQYHPSHCARHAESRRTRRSGSSAVADGQGYPRHDVLRRSHSGRLYDARRGVHRRVDGAWVRRYAPGCC